VLQSLSLCHGVKTISFVTILILCVADFPRFKQRACSQEWVSMEMDLRSPGTDVNVVYLSSYLGKGEAFGHRCDSTCQVEHVWANLYCCRSTNVTHICDKNCNQRVMYDSFNSLCCVSGKLLPLTSGEQEAIEGVKRKRAAKGSESSLYKRRRESHCNPSSIYASQYQRTLPVSSPIGCSENYMDTQ